MKPSSSVAWVVGIVWLASCLLITGCGSKKPIVEKSAALAGAERLERRATTAYGKGDAIGATKDFQAALHVYESLAMLEAAAGVQLSLAKIDSDEGRIKEAQTRVADVLNQSSSLGASTAMLAHGRAAALSLQQKNIAAAGVSLSAAERICANTCEAASALLAMRANWALAGGDAGAAKTHATGALAQAQSPNDKANALRSLAESSLVLGQLPDAATQAEQALQIDQAQGLSARVIADLNLLSAIHAKVGNSDKSSSYAALSRAAAKARAQLIAR